MDVTSGKLDRGGFSASVAIAVYLVASCDLCMHDSSSRLT